MLSEKNIRYYLVPLYWVMVTVAMTGQEWFFAKSYDWLPNLIYKTKWLLYIPFTFVVFWLADRFPIQKPQLFRNIIFHVLFSKLLSILHLVVFSGLVTLLWSTLIGPKGFGEVITKNLTYSFINELLNYWLLLGVHKALTIFKAYQQAKLDKAQLEKQLSDAKLNFLKMQLQPHFLFNTHHNIIGLMQQGEIPKATQMLIKLSDLLRLSLKEGQGDTVSLGQEIELLRLYLDILQIRFGERIQVHMVVPPELANCSVPMMLLQPIVENAVKYGIEPFAKQGQIWIDATQVGERLRLYVRDNGAKVDSVNFQFGVGFTNTLKRLESLYQSSYLFDIQENEGGFGICVIIEIPIR
ncbi:MAG: histidine kinase [Spirosomataceae bacterium]